MMSDVFLEFWTPPYTPKSDFVQFKLMPLFYDIRFWPLGRDIHIQAIQMKLILLFVCAEPAILGSIKTVLKFKYRI